jgi:hypothetical protein
MRNIWNVAIGKRTWIGYLLKDAKLDDLPPLQNGILTCEILETDDLHYVHQLNFLYARDYRASQDMITFLNNYKKLDR